MTNQYDTMDSLDRRYVAYGIGGFAARLDGSPSQFGHPGDDTGRVVAGAYRKMGADEAARVLRSFKQGYDTWQKANGHQALDDDSFISTVGLALSGSLEKPQIAEIVKALNALPRPLTSKRPDF